LENNIRIPFGNSWEIFHDKIDYFIRYNRFEDICPTTREESIDDREARVLRSGTYECHYSFLDPGEEDILLRLGPAVYLIEKEDGLSSFREVFLRLGDDLYDVFFFREDSREMIKLSIERVRYDTSKRGLATSWRSPEKDRWEPPCLDEFPDRFPWSDEMRLSHKVREFLRSEERCERCDVTGEE